MSNLALLMKNTLINEMGINKIKYGGNKERNKAIAMAIIIAFTIVILGGYGFILCFYLSDFLMEMKQMELLLIFGIIGCTFATFFTSLYKASSYLFQSRDYEMLVSLPIKQSTILSSKILMLILNNYLCAALFIIIPGIVYFIKIETSILFIPYLIILTLVAPLIPTLVSSLLAFIITNISSRSKKNNLMSIVLNLSIVALVLVVSMNIQNVLMGIMQNSSSIIEMTQKIYLPSYFFVDALKNGNVVSLVIFILGNIVPAALFIHLFSNNFNKINSKLSETYKANNYEMKELKSSKPVIALLKKEIKRYLSSTVYVLNSSIGMIMLPIFTIVIIFVGYDQIAQMLEINALKEMMLPQILLITAFCLIMTNTSSVSISLEGKNLWILKSSPIEEIDIFKSKILLNIFLTIPMSVICFIALSLKLDFGIKTTILVIIAIILLAIFCATLGIMINLMYPKLEFTSDVAVVKQGASVIITMISNVLYVALLCGIAYVVKINDIDLFLLIANITTLIGVIGLYGLMKTKGVKMFRNL